MEMRIQPTSGKIQTGKDVTAPSNDARLRAVARGLEAVFLSEMLKQAGLGATPEAFGGGVGEEQFASLLRDIQAEAIARKGGIGLAESIFTSLKETTNAR